MNMQALKRVLKYAKPYIGSLILALISAVISVALSLLAPILIGKAIDYIIGAGNVDFKEILRILIYLVAAVLGSALFSWIMSLCTNKVSFNTVRDLRKEVFSKLNTVPLRYVDTNSHGDIISRVVNDIEIISDGLLQGFSQLFTGVVTIVGTLIFMLTINVKITLVVVVATPLSLFVASFIARHTYKHFKEQSAARGELGGYIEEMVGNQKLVKTFGYEQRAQEGFEEINEKLRRTGIISQFFSALTNPTTRFVNGVIYAAVGIIGAISAINGKLSVGQLSSFLQYSNQYTKPFNEISGVITELQTAVASAARVFEVIDMQDEVSDEGLPELSDQSGRIDIDNVYFSYVPEKPLIQGMNLHVKPGQRIAIVGPTGCGKTTVINLLMRFYDVNEGRISVGGQDIREITRDSLRRSFGMVLQETWLFSGTVRENIAYGRPDATEEEIIAAAKAAHAHSFIKRLPDGYDTYISEEGGSISQGQKQLLCIARIMLTNPPMLILDEATSNIDTRTEIRIQRAFEKMMKGKTSFIIAHRLSTIKTADIILVMRDGNVIEQGSHKELLSQGGFYAELYNSQFAPV